MANGIDAEIGKRLSKKNTYHRNLQPSIHKVVAQARPQTVPEYSLGKEEIEMRHRNSGKVDSGGCTFAR
ncbi:hypothetical protein PILCRDRAFT_819628 [Piloderma croceum F 1598]|uniref:Uncharacterized protein n=1 Tax=Piloderma croceum (strain F 1598) TaxID=765440 RepID=A0A0C3FVA9_PILCF|nr:hypothetical protein PILCRDRAFT_819628 [Piloderma croceum F 1598]